MAPRVLTGLGPTLAFGRLDQRAPGYPAAVEAAHAHGFAPLRREVGGRAAAYHEGCVLVEVVEPADDGIHDRFARAAGLLVDAFERCGLEVQVGELPGEYCPGRWSLHTGGVKVGGIAQRVSRGRALTSAVTVPSGGERIRAVLTDVLAALDFRWEPATAGDAGIDPRAFAEAVRAAAPRHYRP